MSWTARLPGAGVKGPGRTARPCPPVTRPPVTRPPVTRPPVTGWPVTGGEAAVTRPVAVCRPAGGGAGPVVAECLDAGSLPRGAAAPSLSRGSGSGFASGDVLDVALPDPGLAGLADAAASGGVGVGRAYTGLSDDELIGVLGGTEEPRRGRRRGGCRRWRS